MMCPHCNYQSHIFNEDCSSVTKGEKGDFYSFYNNIIMKRFDSYIQEEAFVFGCPNCKKLFIED